MDCLLLRKKLGNLRTLSLIDQKIDFASNDTLGLANSPELAALFIKEWEGLRKLGSTGSRLLTGNSQYCENLEREIAHFHGFESALLFGSGYMANVGLLSSLGETTILFDASSHASVRDGIALARAKALAFRHNDLNHLEMRLQSCKGSCLIVVESVYSTDGSKAPLKEVSLLAKQYGARLVVDEAHAVGVYGKEGRGLVEEYGLIDAVFAVVVTFGMALGVYGAAVLGKEALKERLINRAHAFVYSTALPFYDLAAIRSSYRLFPTLESEREHVKKLIQRFQGESSTHIQAIRHPGNEAVKKASLQMREAGYDARPLMSPTVKRGHESLRLCLHSFNTFDELDGLMRVLHG